MTLYRAVVNDVIQLDPARSEWGPLLCIVDEVSETHVRCYALHPEKRDELPSRMYLNCKHGDYVRIGRVEWIIQ